MKLPVTERAIIQRVNRMIWPKKLKKLRGKNPALGPYVLILGKEVVQFKVQLRDIAKEAKAIREYEELK